MPIQETIMSQYHQNMKNPNREITESYKYIIGEFQRQTKKELTDNEIYSILKKIVKNINDEFERDPETLKDNLTLKNIIESILPKEMSRDEIISYIKGNVDFTKLKNPMQAVGLVTKNFGQHVNGNIVKDIIQKEEYK